MTGKTAEFIDAPILVTHSGYLPFKIGGFYTGFEYFYIETDFSEDF